jgi:hypothetical protein
VNVPVTALPFPSVTVSITVYGELDESPTAGVQLNNTTSPGNPQPDGSPDHAYVYGPKPPVAPVVEIAVAWFSSTGFGLADTVPACNAGSTVSVNGAVAVFPLLSVTFNVTAWDPADPAAGVQLNDAAVLLHPVGSPDHAYV